MKSFIDKILAKPLNRDILCLVIPFILWFFCFRHFFTGHLWLQEDAVSYADHINFYTDNLRKGVYPLWNSVWVGGSPYQFFLRRIGDVNPLFFLIILLKSIGVSPASAYLFFLGVYYFLAGLALYLITRVLLVERFYAFTAYILFLFSSWGSEIFYNYIIIIFVPIIWFLYFLICFSRSAQKGFLLGMCLCVGLIVTTYIPFFFLTILTIFAFLFILFYGRAFLRFLKHTYSFVLKNKIFSLCCVAFLMASCIPGLLFYKESKAGEFVMPNRHSGATTTSAVAVGIQNVASGDIVSHGYFDRIFEDHKNIDMGDIYLPYVFFLILLTAVLGRVSKLIFFLLFNILGLSLITITSAAGVHRFLYDHIIFFKFIRNIYYFFWLAMLPMGILLAVTAFKSLLNAIDSSSNKMAWFIYIVICHLLFGFFLLNQQGVLWGAWASIVISLIYFVVYFRFDSKTSYRLGFCLFLLAVFVQSLQVYECLDNKLVNVQIAQGVKPQTISDQKFTKEGDLYYASHWFTVLLNFIDPQVLNVYRHHQFMFYDNVVPYADSTDFFPTFQKYIADNTNVAFVSKYESQQDDWRNNPDAAQEADINPIASGKLTIVGSDANTWKLKTHLADREFLVLNDNYNSGWHAFINGHPARLLRANVSFKGLWVPAGDSNIVLRFSTPMRYLFHFVLIYIFLGSFIYLLVLLRKVPPENYV